MMTFCQRKDYGGHPSYTRKQLCLKAVLVFRSQQCLNHLPDSLKMPDLVDIFVFLGGFLLNQPKLR